jgi:hypothetical protein
MHLTTPCVFDRGTGSLVSCTFTLLTAAGTLACWQQQRRQQPVLAPATKLVQTLLLPFSAL